MWKLWNSKFYENIATVIYSQANLVFKGQNWELLQKLYNLQNLK